MLRHELIIIVIIIQALNPVIILLDLRLLLLNNIFVVVFAAVVFLLFSLFLCCWRPGRRESWGRPRRLGLSLARGDARPQRGRGRVRREGGEAFLRGRGTGSVLVSLLVLLFIVILVVAFLV